MQNLNKNFSGYHQIKGFINNKDEDYYLGIDYPVLRYAEVLLTYAEARAELGELTQDDLDKTINSLRSRAGIPPLKLNPAADPVMQKAFPGISSTLQEIRSERRLELALEGLRNDDLMRWQITGKRTRRPLLPFLRQIRPDRRRCRRYLPDSFLTGYPRRSG